MSTSPTSRVHFPRFPEINFELDLPEKELGHKLRDTALRHQENVVMVARVISYTFGIAMLGISRLSEKDEDLPPIFFILPWVVQAVYMISAAVSPKQ